MRQITGLRRARSAALLVIRSWWAAIGERDQSGRRPASRSACQVANIAALAATSSRPSLPTRRGRSARAVKSRARCDQQYWRRSESMKASLAGDLPAGLVDVDHRGALDRRGNLGMGRIQGRRCPRCGQSRTPLVTSSPQRGKGRRQALRRLNRMASSITMAASRTPTITLGTGPRARELPRPRVTGRRGLCAGCAAE